MSTATAEPKPAAAPPSRGVLLPGRGLSIPRSLVAFGGGAAALVAIVLGHGDLGLFGWAEVGLLGAALGAMLLDRVDAHVFVRSVLWGVLFYGAIDVLEHSHAWATVADQARALTVLLGTAASLLSLGRAGLDGEHGGFFPLVMRRSLLTMMVVGLSVAHVMTVLAIGVAADRWALLATALVTPALFVVGVVGLSRTRSWGFFAYLGALLVTAGSVVLFEHPPEAWTTGGHMLISSAQALSAGWVVGGVVAFAAALPVVVAAVVKPRARPAGKGWGQHVHAAMVVGLVGLTLYAAFA